MEKDAGIMVFNNFLDRALSELLRGLKKCESCNKEKMAGTDIRCYSRRYGMDYLGSDCGKQDVFTVHCKCSSGKRTWYISSGRKKDKEEGLQGAVTKKGAIQQRMRSFELVEIGWTDQEV